MKDGEHIEYYLSGEISSKCNYKDGEFHGEFISYFISGEIYCKCNYLGGKRNGESIRYFDDRENVELYKKYYISGRLVTKLEWISYDRNIKLESIGL